MKNARHDFGLLFRSVARRWGVYALMMAGTGLALTLTLIVGLFIHSELSFDRFIRGSDRVYLVSALYGLENKPLVGSDITPAGVARWMRADMAEARQVTRLSPVEWPLSTPRRIARERFFWADPNLFEVLDLPAVAGDLKTALRAPDSIVMTQRMARAYFGEQDPLGRSLTTRDNRRLRVTAILRDFPANTHLDRELFVSGGYPYSVLSLHDANPTYLWSICYTYVKLRSDVRPEAVARQLTRLTHQNWQGPNNIPVSYELIALKDLHLHERGDLQMKARGHVDTLLALALVAVVILLIACANYAGLVLAETDERGAEMALLSALGAGRAHLLATVLRESLIVHLLSLLLALALTERLLPHLNHSLNLDLRLWSAPPGLMGLMLLLTVALALLSALLPAIIVTAPSPVRRARMRTRPPQRWQGWVIAQFTLVISLLIAAQVVSRQWDYALDSAPGFDGQHVAIVDLSDNPWINRAFLNEIRQLKGVDSVAQAFGAPTSNFVRPALVRGKDGRLLSFTRTSVSPEFLGVYGIPLRAGRNLDHTFSEVVAPKDILINETAVRALGFASPREALGQVLGYETDRTHMQSRIIGVVPDIRFSTVHYATPPMMIDGFDRFFTHFSIRVKPGNEAETLRQIDQIWLRHTGGTEPIERQGFRDYLRSQYHDLHQQVAVSRLVAGVAILLSALGLMGLCVFLTRHQSRELAIRKALGAHFGDLLLYRIRPFLLPLLIANIAAWPLAGLVLQQWLETFAAHVTLTPLPFVLASLATSASALGAILLHAVWSNRRVRTALLRQDV